MSMSLEKAYNLHLSYTEEGRREIVASRLKNAIRDGDLKMLNELVEQVNEKEVELENLICFLGMVVEKGDLAALNILLEIWGAIQVVGEKAWVNSINGVFKSIKLMPLLDCAAEKGYEPIVKRLLEIQYADEDNIKCALEYAAERGHLAVVDSLLEALDAEAGVFWSAYHTNVVLKAVENGHLVVASRLLKNDNNNAVLRVAVARSDLAVVDRLLEIPSVLDKLDRNVLMKTPNKEVIYLLYKAYQLLGKVSVFDDITVNNMHNILLSTFLKEFEEQRAEELRILENVLPFELVKVVGGYAGLPLHSFNASKVAVSPKVLVEEAESSDRLHRSAKGSAAVLGVHP